MSDLDVFLICIPTLTVLSAWGMLLEKGTNMLGTNWFASENQRTLTRSSTLFRRI